MTPALTHEDANGQLMDLVYGEAEGATRAALEAHVAGCAQCQADLAALGQTHELLRGTFEDLPVPARAHARILEAAKAAVPKAAVAPAAAVAARAPVVAKPEAPSFWERMRGRWTLPTLATVGAVAVVVVSSRLFLDPNRAFEQMQEQRAPAEPVAPAEAPSAAAPAAPPVDDQAQAERAIDEALHRRRNALEQLRSTPPGARGALRSRSLDDRLRSAVEQIQRPGTGRADGVGGVATGSLGGVAANRDELAKSAEAKAPVAEKADKVAAKPVAAPKPAAAPARNERAYASPPADWAAGGGPKGGAVAQAPSPAPAAPPPASAAAPFKRKMLQKDQEERDDAPAAEASAQPMEMEERASSKSESAASDKKKQKEAAPTAEALTRKAEQLFAAGRWDEAVAAYRDLLRRFPDADPSTQWRTRLIQAQRQQLARDKAATKAAPAAQ